MMLDTTKNRAMAELVFDKMIGFGFEPYDIMFGDTYFIFNHGEDSIVHFRVKGVSKHWKFGMWIHSDALNMPAEQVKKELAYDGYTMYNRTKVLQLFVQWDTQIDKFKPSASDIIVEYDVVEWLDYERDPLNLDLFWEIKELLYALKRHPFMAYYGMFGGVGYKGFYSRSFLWNFIRSEYPVYRDKLLSLMQYIRWVPYTWMKCRIASLDPCVDSVELEDFEKLNPGFSTSYRYGVRVTFSKDSPDRDDSDWLRFWFRRKRYGKICGAYRYMVELLPLRKNGSHEYYEFMEE